MEKVKYRLDTNYWNWKSIKKSILRYKYIYLLLIPGLLFLLVFKYAPMYGIQLAFKDYKVANGISGSEFIGFANFEYLFMEQEFWAALKNTLIISVMKMLIGFPIPVLLAIGLNEIISAKFKKTLQVIFTFPHFLSWVVVSGLIFNMLSTTGAVNAIIQSFGAEKIAFLTNVKTFRWLLVFTEAWKEAGWSSILYIATIASIDNSLYEAAKIDGANRWQKITHVIWPVLKKTVAIMLIMSVGSVLNVSFDQVFNLYNPVVYPVADVLSTYVYRISFTRLPDFGVSTAVGLFTGVINCILLLTANSISKKMGQEGIV